MAQFDIGPADSIQYKHERPERIGAPSFVFVNALTGNLNNWESVVAPALRAEGFATLSYNLRGQDGSTFSPGTELTPALIIDDLARLLDEVSVERPILVGLSIGGLFAAHALLQGARAEGLVLFNTLREIGPRIAWVNDAMPLIVKTGGIGLFMDALLPLLVNQEFSQSVRSDCVKDDYQPLDPNHGHANLMRHASSADWDLPYEQLKLPTLVITGLQDRVFLDREVVDRLFARLPNGQAEFWENAGHLLPQERPDQLISSLSRFG
ncbi:MAG: alpha/beta fold hydrolase [Hyphomicrobiaceae bacterium]